MGEGTHWSESKGQLGQDFASCALPRLGDRIGALAGNNQFLFMAERHTDISTLNVLSHPDTLRGIAQGGHKAIATEMFHVGYNKVFEGYFNGEFSDQAIRFAIDNTPTNYEADMGIENSGNYLRRYGDIIQTARDHGMRMYGVGGHEGFYERENLPAVEERLDRMGNIFYDALKIADTTPGFFGMPQAEQDALLARDLSEAGHGAEDHYIVRTSFGLGGRIEDDKPKGFVSHMENDEIMNVLAERLDQDDIVAGRIADISEKLGGGVTTIYGGLHLWRGGAVEGDYGYIGNDIDDALGNDRSAVISVFTDSRKFWQSDHPNMRATREMTGMKLENVGDYQLNMKGGTWYDGRTGTDCKVELPESLRPAAPNPAPDMAVPRSVMDVSGP